jgi:hypothetical protein
MLTKSKIALAIALVAGSASVASAQGFDPNPANRFPHYSAPNHGMPYIGAMPQGPSQNVVVQRAPRGGLQSAPVRLQQGRNAAQFDTYGVPQYGVQQDEVGTDLQDRASSPYAGGVN